jgi:hypothetical protein
MTKPLRNTKQEKHVEKTVFLVVEILSRWVETGKNNRFFSGSGLN